MDIPVEQIKLMNPQYRRSIIPGDIKPYAVVLPIKSTGKFIDKLEEIVAYKADSLVNTRRTEVNVPQATASSKVIYHKVTKGQTLSGIAARYGVSVTRIKQWNHIKGSIIKPGQRIKIMK